jgi:EmrB/QacA subfamily drug resistance transporter
MPYKWRVLLCVGLGSYMATMDSSIVNIALPTFARVFHTSPNTALWVSLAFLLTTTGLTLTLGRLGDMFGRKRIYVAGFAVFTLGMTLAGLAQNLPQLLAVRVLQACGAAMVTANGTALTTAAFPAHERGRAIGTNGAIVGAGLLTGPVIGGFLLDALGWRAIFYTRIPIGLIALATAWWIIRDTRPATADRRLDVPGAVSLFVALAAFLLAINRGQAWGWTSPAIGGLAVLSAAALAAFVTIEARSPSPIVALALFRDRLLAASVLSQTLNFVALAAVTLLMPFYLIRVLHLSPARSGLVLIAVPLLRVLLSPFTGALSDRIGSRQLATAGVLVQSAGLLALVTLGAATPLAVVVACLAVVGAGSAIFGSPNNSTIMGRVPPTMLGIGAATIATGRNIGQATGIALAGAVFTAVAAAHAGVAAGAARADTLPPEAILAGVRGAFAVAAAVSGASLVASFFRVPTAGGAVQPLVLGEGAAPQAAEPAGRGGTAG